MKKSGFWQTDAALGVLVTLCVFVVAISTDAIQRLERTAYDMAVGMTTRPPSDKIAIIAIDKQSLDNIGRWPWSREVQAGMIEKLAAAKAKVIATSVLYAEPQRDAGLSYINRLAEIYVGAGGLPLNDANIGAEQLASQSGWLGSAGPVLQDADVHLNTDRRLAAAVQTAGNVVLPMVFVMGAPLGRPDKALPEYVQRNALAVAAPGNGSVLQAMGLDAAVIDEVGGAAALIGHLNAPKDADGGIRAEPLAVEYFDRLYPSLSLLVAAHSLNLKPADIQIVPGEQVRLGNLVIATDAESRMRTFYYKDEDGKPAFPVDSFFDVSSGKIPLDKYKDKIVLIGSTVAGVGSVHVTPVSPQMADVQVIAHTISSILSEHFFVTPAWGGIVPLLLYLLVAAYLIALLPRMKADRAAWVTGGLFVLLLMTHFGLMTTQLIWLQLMLPATLLLVGHAVLTTKRFLATERGKEKSDLDSAESNRMLGLAFQGQGQLDMAFDKFRKCPLDEQLMENMYNLGLDFERKRQFNKAEAVFRYLADFNPKFRDLEQKLARARQMAETIILGGGNHRSNASLALEGGTVEKPMLGRYQVEKELGKGAMGVVYLGRDPKINRVVAIKTMALAQEFEEDELAEVKERFFREAETAGRLNHPNIVTMYDAGEEHDLAYIAMEFLKGRDLVSYTKPGALLDVARVTSIIARVADALSYAHKNNVVHRDIKPANIMYEPESDQVKVTDFGIARITDSSRTKTGMVLGTPSYMSPEQLAGKKIDGRSDIFSLGAMLYQLLCGNLPFVGESMAQLMYRIANEPHPDVRTYNPEITEALAAIVDRALAKDLNQRYQTGEELAQALRSLNAGTGSSTVDISL